MIEPTTTEKEVDTVRIKQINCTRKYLDTLRKRTAPFKLIFHESVTFVPHFFVNDCVSLVEVIFEGKIEAIGMSAFEKCICLTHVHFKGGVERIFESAFSECHSLGPRIELPYLTRVDKNAFLKCQSLKDIRILYSFELNVNRMSFC